MTATDPTTAQPATPGLDLDAITDSGTGWDRDWIADLPGCLPSSSYLKPDLAGRAQREIAALLADVDRLVAEVRRLRAERDAAPAAPTGKALEDRIAQAIGDPGSILPRYHQSAGEPYETVTRWSTRAVLAVLAAAGPLSSVPPAGTEGENA